VKLTKRSTLPAVAAAASEALAEAGIDAVLTGGAAATIHSGGAYSSHDLDYVVRRGGSRQLIDDALAGIGFRRDGNRYVHDSTPFFIEFVAGPLAVGGDVGIRPVILPLEGGTVTILSPTDSCRDRLAAFYHWSDRQSLDAAIEIAARHPINLSAIRRWSLREGHSDKFEEFRQAVERRSGL